MRIARKNISLLSRAKKGRLYATRPKPQKRSGRSWRNIARASRFLFSEPISETTDKTADDEFFRRIEEIEFEFGHEIHTVEEAKPLFAYEIGLDLLRVYVIALTVNFGTIIFYIPDELAADISEYIKDKTYSFHWYISKLIEFRRIDVAIETVSKAAAAAGITAQEAADAFMKFAISWRRALEKPVDLRFKSNNWLKMHGYPMRRKGKGKKK